MNLPKPKKYYPSVDYLCRLAREAGEVMIRNLRMGTEKLIKEDGTPVTPTDVCINNIILHSILRDYPHIHVMSEEGGHEVLDAEYTLICDPLDGTIPFSHGIAISTFVISLLRDWQPIVAVIYDPFMSRMWWAERTKGAYLNNKRTRVSTHPTLVNSHIAISWWYDSIPGMGSVVQGLMDARVLWSNALSIAYYGGLLASGEQEATIFPERKCWETPAIQLLAEEAGGRATDFSGNPLRYDSSGRISGHVISNGLIHDMLLGVIAVHK